MSMMYTIRGLFPGHFLLATDWWKSAKHLGALRPRASRATAQGLPGSTCHPSVFSHPAKVTRFLCQSVLQASSSRLAGQREDAPAHSDSEWTSSSKVSVIPYQSLGNDSAKQDFLVNKTIVERGTEAFAVRVSHKHAHQGPCHGGLRSTKYEKPLRGIVQAARPVRSGG